MYTVFGVLLWLSFFVTRIVSLPLCAYYMGCASALPLQLQAWRWIREETD